ncbi:MAG: hypothetical protein Q6M04_06095, partial [Thermostichus sp. BF3_bins_97]
MRILRQTPTLLAVQESSRLLLLVFGIPFVLVGLGFFLFVGQVVVLQCQRSVVEAVGSVVDVAPVCSLRREKMLATAQQNIGVLLGAEVEETVDEVTNHRVTLYTNLGQYPLTSFYNTGYDYKRRISAQINHFVQDTNQTGLQIRHDERWIAYLFGGIFLPVGLLITGISFGRTRFTFDKHSGKLQVHKVSLLSNRVIEYPLHLVRSVEVEESSNSDGDPVYRICLGLSNGVRIPLSTTEGYSSGRAQKESLAVKIRSFLG